MHLIVAQDDGDDAPADGDTDDAVLDMDVLEDLAAAEEEGRAAAAAAASTLEADQGSLVDLLMIDGDEDRDAAAAAVQAVAQVPV